MAVGPRVPRLLPAPSWSANPSVSPRWAFEAAANERHYVDHACVPGESDAVLTENPGQVRTTDVRSVPADAATVFVYAHHGANLDVRLVGTAAPA